MGYVFLGLAIIACVAGSSALTASDGMVIKKYSVLGVLIFAISYVLLSRSILRAIQWAKDHHIELTGSAYERYVIDIYTSDNQDEYVTEILLPAAHDSEEFNYLSREFV